VEPVWHLYCFLDNRLFAVLDKSETSTILVLFSMLNARLINFLLLITCLTTLCLSAYQTLYTPASARPHTFLQGQALSSNEIDWSHQTKTLLLAFQVGCPYCSASAPFYRRLWDVTHRKGIPLIAVSPQPVGRSGRYLKEFGVNTSSLKQLDLAGFGILNTPTLLLVDTHGVVVQSWIGQLDPATEEDVLKTL